MLITCPECGLSVSDKAYSCPHCGFPMNKGNGTPRKRNPSRMRLPNGFGQISEIKGRNLRNPFRVMVNVGFTEEGRPISKILRPQGYFKTYNEAYQALLEYHKDPRAFGNDMTVAELFAKWKDDFQKSQPDPAKFSANQFSYGKIESIHDLLVQDVSTKDIRKVMEENDHLASNTKVHIKNMLNQLFDFAVENEIISHNPSRDYAGKIKKTPQKHHIPFTNEELEILWSHEGEDIFTDMILFNCYSGWRPGEMIELKISNISDSGIIGGKKTQYGINRTVPIHSKVKSIVSRYYDPNSEYLFSKDGSVMTYIQYSYGFKSVISNLRLNPNHTPHDCRVTFISMLKNAGANEYIIKRLAGHSTNDITENTYTHWSAENVRKELEKI